MANEPSTEFNMDEAEAGVTDLVARSHGRRTGAGPDIQTFGGPVDPHTALLLEHRDILMRDVPENIRKINDPATELSVKIELISKTMSQLIVPLMSEALSAAPNADRSIVFSRILMFLRGMSEQLNKKREVEESDDINVHSAKFQKIFGWFMDIVYVTMEEQKVDPIHLNNIFNALHDKFVGWEDKVSKNLQGISGKALNKVENPFIKEWVEELKQGNTG